MALDRSLLMKFSSKAWRQQDTYGARSVLNMLEINLLVKGFTQVWTLARDRVEQIAKQSEGEGPA